MVVAHPVRKLNLKYGKNVGEWVGEPRASTGELALEVRACFHIMHLRVHQREGGSLVEVMIRFAHLDCRMRFHGRIVVHGT